MLNRFWRPAVRVPLGAAPVKHYSRAREVVGELLTKLEDQNRARTTADLTENRVRASDRELHRPDLGRLRVVPKDSAFYMHSPPHEEIMRQLTQLEQRYINLPTVPHSAYQPSRWLTLADYRERAGGPRVRPRDYKDFVQLATRLDMIDPQLVPADVESILAELRRDSDQSHAAGRPIRPLDAQGRAIAVGNRKTSSARVITAAALPGTTGQLLVNGKTINLVFPELAQRLHVTYPLRVTETASQYNIFATVTGGGVTGQAEAVAHGIAQTLRMHNPLLGPRLKKAGCLTRDIRIKERKKPGLAKARKAYTWVKR